MLLSIFLCRNPLLTKFISLSFFLRVANHGLTSYKLLQYCFSSRSASFFWSYHWYKKREIPTRKGKYPVIRTNAKPQQLIKHAKISYSIASLVFRKISCRTYRNGLNQGTSKLRPSKCLKSMNCVSLASFVGNPHFCILLHRLRYLKNLFVSRR